MLIPTFTFIVPVPPSTNTAYTHGHKHGRRVLSEKGRNYKQTVTGLLFAHAPTPIAYRSTFADPAVRLGFSLHVYFGDKRNRDLDNYIKLLLDALAETLHFNDCQVDRLEVTRGPINKANPHAIVTLGQVVAAR